jgi:hypothetical protein
LVPSHHPRSETQSVRRRYRVIFLNGEPKDQVIEADDCVDDGRSLVFRNLTPDGSFAPVMSLRASVVSHIVEDGAALRGWEPSSPNRRSFSFDARVEASSPG